MGLGRELKNIKLCGLSCGSVMAAVICAASDLAGQSWLLCDLCSFRSCGSVVAAGILECVLCNFRSCGSVVAVVICAASDLVGQSWLLGH